MKRRSVLFAAIALAAMSLFGSAVQAGTVTSDSGTIGPFRLTNTGISDGVSHLSLDLTAPLQELLHTVNGANVSISASFESPITFDVSGSPGAYRITSGTFTKTFGTAPEIAMLSYSISSGATALITSPGQSPVAFFNLAGLVSAVAPNALPGFDFSLFSGGEGVNNITLTSTDFTGGDMGFDKLISTPGESATGSGAFSESAIPEPASLALLGIGLSGLLTFRRFFKRTSRLR